MTAVERVTTQVTLPNTPGEENAIRKGARITAKIAGDAGAASRVTKLTAAIIDFIGNLFIKVSTGLANFRLAIGTFADVVDIFATLRQVNSLIQGKLQTLAEKISVVFLTVFRALFIVKFLEKIKAINLTSFMNTLGRIPVLGLIVHVPLSAVGLASLAFDVAHHTQMVTGRTKDEITVYQKVQQHWALKQELFEAVDPQGNEGRKLTQDDVQRLEASQENILALRDQIVAKKYSKEIQSKLVKSMEAAITMPALNFIHNLSPKLLDDEQKAKLNVEHVANVYIANVGSKPYLEEHREYLEAKLELETKKWEVLTNNAKIDRNKSFFAIVCDVIKIAFIVLGIVAMFGFAVVAVTSPIGLSVALTGALLSVGQAIYDKYYDKADNKSMQTPKDPDIVASYRARPPGELGLTHNKSKKIPAFA